jgi:hypothetical protein
MVRSEVFTAVFWDVTPCRYFVNRRYGGTYHLHLQGRKIRVYLQDDEYFSCIEVLWHILKYSLSLFTVYSMNYERTNVYNDFDFVYRGNIRVLRASHGYWLRGTLWILCSIHVTVVRSLHMYRAVSPFPVIAKICIYMKRNFMILAHANIFNSDYLF